MRPPAPPANPSNRGPVYECPDGHKHWEESNFCTTCGAGPVLEVLEKSRPERLADWAQRIVDGLRGGGAQ